MDASRFRFTFCSKHYNFLPFLVHALVSEDGSREESRGKKRRREETSKNDDEEARVQSPRRVSTVTTTTTVAPVDQSNSKAANRVTPRKIHFFRSFDRVIVDTVVTSELVGSAYNDQFGTTHGLTNKQIYNKFMYYCRKQ